MSHPITRERIEALAAKFQQYPGAVEITLRGEGIHEFACALLAEHEAARIAPAIEQRVLDLAREVDIELRGAWTEPRRAIGDRPRPAALGADGGAGVCAVGNTPTVGTLAREVEVAP